MKIIISLQQTRHDYKTYRKKEGFKGAFQDLFRRVYEVKTALHPIQLTIKQGEFIGLLGPNGAGKTTFMKIISGLIKPSGGSIEVMGFSPYEKSPHYLRQLGMVLGQKSQLAWDLPPIDTLLVLKEIYRVDSDIFQARVSDLADKLNVADCLHTPVRKLSLGQRMKYEIIASLLHSPKLLLLDEPTIGLDVQSQRAIRQFLKDMNQHEGTTIILTSHYAKDIEELANRLIILKQCHIHYDGPLNELMLDQKTNKIISVETLAEQDLSKLGFTEKGVRKWEITVSEKQLNETISLVLELGDISQIKTDEIPLEEKLFTFFEDKDEE